MTRERLQLERRQTPAAVGGVGVRAASRVEQMESSQQEKLRDVSGAESDGGSSKPDPPPAAARRQQEAAVVSHIVDKPGVGRSRP
ncbi:hypothetical protein KIN20_028603 [Parelaphostrongylus tenuis]|uniref:Uncharacterized protein n=1 Tax=Parelaphostrongylus tenuis TaxID=148309 RepID=A0AAD5R1V0_PARTN|nr:hypothetical protein KIN20_028603 [Parelaphostrongylus tenuis]